MFLYTSIDAISRRGEDDPRRFLEWNFASQYYLYEERQLEDRDKMNSGKDKSVEERLSFQHFKSRIFMKFYEVGREA